MRTALLIAAKDLRQRMRDRSALVLGFVAPLVIAALMSFAFKGTDSFHTTIDLVDQDSGELSTGFEQMLAALSCVICSPCGGCRPSRAGPARRGQWRSAGAALVVPPTFTAGAHGGHSAPVTVLASVDHVIDARLAESLTHSFTAQVDADRLSVATALAAGSATQLGAQPWRGRPRGCGSPSPP